MAVSRFKATDPKKFFGKREGYVKDLSPREQREMFAADRKRRLGVATRRSKSFLKEHAPLIAVGTLVVLMLAFKKELKSAVGHEPFQLTP